GVRARKAAATECVGRQPRSQPPCAVDDLGTREVRVRESRTRPSNVAPGVTGTRSSAPLQTESSRQLVAPLDHHAAITPDSPTDAPRPRLGAEPPAMDTLQVAPHAERGEILGLVAAPLR